MTLFGRVREASVLGLRSMQVACLGAVITGFIWATSDYLLLTVLVESPVTPLSILLMLYGTLGTGLSEIVVRLLNRKNRFLDRKQEAAVDG